MMPDETDATAAAQPTAPENPLAKLAPMPYDTLSDIIKDETPYDDEGGVTLGLLGVRNFNAAGDELPATLSVDKQGLTKEHNLANPFDKETLDDAENQQCYWWFYDGKLQRVTKAIRIPYRFRRNEKDQFAYVLVGFEGPSAQ